MNIKKKFLLFFFFIPFISYAQNTSHSGEQLIQTCTPCHGEDGNSPTSAYPKIAGQNKRYFMEQILDFKKGKVSGRDNMIMTSVVTNLSNDEIEFLANYYAKQKPTYGAASPDLVKLGRQIYRGGDLEQGIPACSACHDPQGLGNAVAGFPHIGGQYADYIAQQLQAYKKGTRTNDINKMMTTIGKKLSDEQITAVANYISGLH